MKAVNMEIAVIWDMTPLYFRHFKRIERPACGGGRLALM
jgi:hypothetical protein